jgi:carbamoyltransferase
LVKIAQDAYQKTRSKNLCLAGGIALNSVANKIMLDRTPFEHIFVQPASGDDGCALGNALIGWRQIMGENENFTMHNAYTGRSYSEDEVLEAINEHASWIRVERPKDALGETCRLLTEQKIIGWFQEGSEFGPRSLGHRTILCDPRHPQMKDILNKRVKHREAFRPFAPSILVEHAQDYFELDDPSPYMLLIAKVKRPDEVPAITHADQTGRVQTVTREANGVYYQLIERFHQMTGTPVLLNTSFNDNEEPIVETPNDAIRCFLKTNIDYLIIGDRIIEKKWVRCKTLRIWPNDFKRWMRRKAKSLSASSSVIAWIVKVMRRVMSNRETVHTRIPG